MNDAPEHVKSRDDIELEKYKTRYGFYKIVVGTALVGIASIVIPGAIEFWRITFENQRLSYQYELDNSRKKIEIELNQINQQQEYVKDFLETALNQDIELRIRFADYFSKVSAAPFREDWTAYWNTLVEVRNATRAEIHEKEEAILKSLSVLAPTTEEQIENARLSRELEWRYREIGYVARDRSIVRSEGETESSGSLPALLASQDSYERVDIYNPTSSIRRDSKIVGRVIVKYKNENFRTCTGILISNEEVLTTSYCTNSSDKYEVSEITFILGYYSISNVSDVNSYKMEAIAKYRSNSLDYAILSFGDGISTPPVVDDVRIRAPVVGEEISFFHHPLGQPMSVSRSNCRVIEVTEDNIQHTCHSLPGSGGGGLFGSDGALLGMHYAGSTVPNQPSFAIRLDKIR